MHRNPILTLLNNHVPFDETERDMLRETVTYIEGHSDCFERSSVKGHVTGSAWIINPEGTHTLLVHHVKLDRWLQPGGHCDGDPDVLRVALKEVHEETGLSVEDIRPSIFDVDRHLIPQRLDLPAHFHYDIRFLVWAPKDREELPANHEVKTARWIRLEDVYRYNDDPSILRMVKKTLG